MTLENTEALTKEQIAMTTAQTYLNNKYPSEQREFITELDISGWNEDSWTAKPNWEKLTGELDLSDFPNLEKLNCSYNQITSLKLSNCPKLTELKCWDNQLTEIKFPNSQLKLKTFYAWTNNLTEINWKAFSPQNLTHFSISNNDLKEQDLSVFNQFTNLEELYLGTDLPDRIEKGVYNHFFGSLKSLQSLTNLKKLQIEGTSIQDGSEFLSKSLERIVCWDEKNREAIINQLGLTREEALKIKTSNRDNLPTIISEITIDRTRRHSLVSLTPEQVKQVKEESAALALSVQSSEKDLKSQLGKFEQWMLQISTMVKGSSQKIIKELEKKALAKKLTSVHDNIKKFLDSWGKKDPQSLKSAEQLKKYEWGIWFSEWGGRVIAATGGVLALNDGYNKIGGAIGVTYPVINAIVASLKEKNEANKKDLEDFEREVTNLGDNYSELIKVLEPIKISASWIVNSKIRGLNDKIYGFLEECDIDGNKLITIDEIELTKDKLPKYLKGNWSIKKDKLREVMQAVDELKEKICEQEKTTDILATENKDNQYHTEIEINPK